MNTPVVALETQSLLEQFSDDRPVFHGRLSRGLGGGQFFQVFGCRTGFLCLEAARKSPSESHLTSIAKWCAAIWFGLFAVIGYALIMRKKARHKSNLEFTSDTLLSDDELVELARKRKRSFVARYEDIAWARIDPPSLIEQLIYGTRLQGTITFREKVVGKITIQVRDRPNMESAIDVFSRRLGDRATIRLAFDPRRQRFVTTRPT